MPQSFRLMANSALAVTFSGAACTVAGNVIRFVTPDEFKAYETTAYAKGFLLVSSTPLTRSSHHAGEDFARLKAARLAQAGA